MPRAALALLLAPLAIVIPSSARADPPKLVVILVVDQMRNDYIDDYGGHWTKGLKRLVTEGARFRDAAYPYLNTVTCAGHASIGTGTIPAVHGIVLNAWWDRDSQKMVSCTDDPRTPDISMDERPVPGGHSPARLLVPSFAETLWRAESEKPRVVTMSLKPRSAIMLAGHRADAAIWFDAPSWASSSAFTKGPIPFLQRFVAAHPVQRDIGRTWERRLPAADYRYTDDAVGEQPVAEWGRTFPHPIGKPGGPADNRFYEEWEASPYADAYLGEMAAAAVEDLRLGQRSATDFLGVSFSTLDLVGHNYGPRSHEVQDVLAALDETLGRLFGILDAKVGKGQYVVAFSADHGVATIPEQLAVDGTAAGRVSINALSARIEATMVEAFGAPGPYVARLEYTYLYLRPGVMDRLKARPDVLDRVKRAITSTPGIAGVLVASDLDAAHPPTDPVARAAALNQYGPRSADLVVLPALNFFFVQGDGPPTGTTHGTAHPYDQRVPVLFYGAGIKAGTYDGPAAPIDIAPTLARLCGVELPTATGHVLDRALQHPGEAAVTRP